ncbi:hypothetical protein E4T56_gene8003 [Termitomyces sp. T112]|nr:hypothetical protein E4T56_gene8003 [Termitomyces sp. T112]
MGKPDALSRRADHGTGAGDNDNIVLLKPELFAICTLEEIVAQGDEANILRDIQRSNQEGAQEDAVAQATQALQAQWASGVKSVHADEWGLHQLHPVFNVVKLFPAPEDPIPECHPKPSLLPVLVNDEEEYEVEEILDSRAFQGKLQFEVKWKGYGIKDISWELQANVHASGLVQNFYCRHSNAPKAI